MEYVEEMTVGDLKDAAIGAKDSVFEFAAKHKTAAKCAYAGLFLAPFAMYGLSNIASADQLMIWNNHLCLGANYGDHMVTWLQLNNPPESSHSLPYIITPHGCLYKPSIAAGCSILYCRSRCFENWRNSKHIWRPETD